MQTLLTVLGVLGVLAVLFVAAAVATRDDEVLVEAPGDNPGLDLPEGPLQPADIAAVRFGMALRGYRMAEVDELLERVVIELTTRDAQLRELRVALAQRSEPAASSRAEAQPAGARTRAGAGAPAAGMPGAGGPVAWPAGWRRCDPGRRLLAMTASLELTVDVDAPAEKTWAGATDWARQGEWMLGTRVRGTAQDGVGVGGGIEAFTGVGRLGFLDVMTVTVWEPPARCHVLHTGRVVRGTGEFEVRDRGGDRSTFVWREDLELPLGVLGAAGWPLVRPLFTAGVQASLRRFARWVEAGRP